MRLYRVFSYLASAQAGEPGHLLYVSPVQGRGRVDNPDHYRALYLSSAPAGAVAEAFGTLKTWTPDMFIRPELPGSERALGTYTVPDDARILDLDDPAALVTLGLRPSDVVTRQIKVTQRWALRIFEQRRWVGVGWWSYYDPRWHSYAIWERGVVRRGAVEPLSLDDPVVTEASEVLRRPLVRS